MGLVQAYLVLYNSLHSCGWWYLFGIIVHHLVTVGLWQDTHDFADKTTWLLTTLQTAAFAEVLHSVVGLTSTALGPAILQHAGRLLQIFLLIHGIVEMGHNYILEPLYFAWVAIETVRYPFYVTELLKSTPGALTWLRYSLFIPLYPMGFMGEWFLIYQSIPFIEEGNMYSLTMPNSFNFGFNCAVALKATLVLQPLIGVMLFKNMMRQRTRKLSPTKKAKKQ